MIMQMLSKNIIFVLVKELFEISPTQNHRLKITSLHYILNCDIIVDVIIMATSTYYKYQIKLLRLDK